jgi:16S rRNA (guanine1207-N2)-methyltransferase
MLFSIGEADTALEALHTAFSTGTIKLPADGRVLFLRAREGGFLHEFPRANWQFEQTFKPFADALVRNGLNVVAADKADMPTGQTWPLVIVLPPRQREEARALYARAVSLVAPGGTVVASVSNAEGARSSEADLARLAGPTQSLSKHKCRVFWAAPSTTNIDTQLLAQWAAIDAPRSIDEGRFVSRPGLFAWDRIDPASALLAEHLPATLAGHVADLGAGYGYLASEVVRRCPRVTAIDLYEAEARALEPARLNLARAAAGRGGDIQIDVKWHDVSTGLTRMYNAIVSNPPFHLGRADRPELGRSFIDAAANALTSKGSLWLVANRHLPYEATLTARFAQVRVVTQKNGFKVFEACRDAVASMPTRTSRP